MKHLNKMDLDDIIEAYHSAFKKEIIPLDVWLLESVWNEEFEDYLDDRFDDTDVAYEFNNNTHAQNCAIRVTK